MSKQQSNAGNSGRLRLPNRRRAETFELDHGGFHYSVTVGHFENGNLAEDFY